MNRKGAGYSIEVVLAAVILFTFAYGAIQIPEQKDWSNFQREVAARDITFALKETGDINNALRNSNPEAMASAIGTISKQDLKVSGNVENLPLNQLSLGFHTMPSEIHMNFTEPIQPGDTCEGGLNEIKADSEHPILKTNTSQFLENKHGVRLYFGDTDIRNAGGYNGKVDYDALWVDNGTRCVFNASEGPYLTDEIFMWGNTSDSDPDNYYEFKDFNLSQNRFTVYRADQAFQFKKSLNKPLNGINTDTAVDTFNFSSPDQEEFNVVIFQKNESLSRISTYRSNFNSIISNSSVLFLMNLSEQDLQHDFMQDIGFKWMDAGYTSSPSDYQATFSDYSSSEGIQTYFQGLGGSTDKVSLSPGGKVISSQGTTRTSRDDLLYARNTAYDTSSLDGKEIGSDANIGGACGDDTQATFEFPGGNHEVRILDLAGTGSCDQRRGVKIRIDGEWKGPYLENERIIVNNRSYFPDIADETTATFKFAGSQKVELVNHRKVLERMTGGRVARAAYQEDYSQSDIKMLSSVVYWLRGDQVSFEGTGGSSALVTDLIGGIDENIFIPYKLQLRWSE